MSDEHNALKALEDDLAAMKRRDHLEYLAWAVVVSIVVLGALLFALSQVKL